MTNSKDCKSGKQKLTAAEWRAQWDEDRARAFNVAKAGKILEEVRDLLRNGPEKPVPSIPDLASPSKRQEDTNAAQLLCEIRELLDNDRTTSRSTDFFWDSFAIPDGWKAAGTIDEQVLAGKSPKAILIDFVNYPGMTEGHLLLLSYILKTLEIDVVDPEKWIKSYPDYGDFL